MSELRLKSFEDLHKLWFVCLKEKNMLLTERLYFKQMKLAMPDGVRYAKVKTTMARVKTVLGERERALEALMHARGEFVAPTTTEYTGVPVTVKKFGRTHTVPADHPFAVKATRAEKMSASRIDRRRRLWKAKHAMWEKTRAPIPEEAVRWMEENIKTADDLGKNAAYVPTALRSAEAKA